MLSLSQRCWWPYIPRDKIAKASEFNACTDIGTTLKPVVTRCKWSPFIKSEEQDEEIQIVFGGPILNEKEQNNTF